MATATVETGNTLRVMRERAGVTMDALAQRTGMDYARMSKVERDRMPVPTDWPKRYEKAIKEIVRERAESVGLLKPRAAR